MAEATQSLPSQRSPRRRRAWLALRLAVLAAVGVGLVLCLRGLRLAKLGAVLAQARKWPIVLAAVLSFANLLAKAVCWRVMLARVARVPVLRLFRYVIAAGFVSALAPVRGGEVLRVWLLKRRDGVPLATGAAVALSEKVLSCAALLIVIAPLPWLLPGLPSWVGHTLVGILAFAVVVLVAGRVTLGRARADGRLARFTLGLEILRRPGALCLTFATLLLAWLADLAGVWLVLSAVGLHLPLAAGLLVLLTVNLAIVVPSTPGQMGVLELGAVVGLQTLGVDRAPALAFALLYHAMQVVPVVLVGLLDAPFVLAARRAAATEAAAAPR